jgi:hypothetical protein
VYLQQLESYNCLNHIQKAKEVRWYSGDGTDCIFNHVVVDFKGPVMRVSQQGKFVRILRKRRFEGQAEENWLFSGNLIFSQKRVRTKKVNEVLSLLVNTSKAFQKIKSGQSNKKLGLSVRVTHRGPDSNHTLDNLLKFNKLSSILLLQNNFNL